MGFFTGIIKTNQKEGNMGLNYFTDEQVKKLESNPNVKNVSRKSITYKDTFKSQFIQSYNLGSLPKQIFKEAGFDIDVLGKSRIYGASCSWKLQAERPEGFKDTRKGRSGRPRTKDLSKDEIIIRQKAQIEYLKQERDFLLELERLERLAIKKETLSRTKSTKSSKG